LACDKIIMDSHAVLGPVDPQIQGENGGSKAAASILAVAEEKGTDAEDATLIMADISRKAIAQMEELVCQLTDNRQVVEELVSGRFTHDYPITPSKAQELGIQVETDLPKEVYQLMDMYPQRQRGKPTVEYVSSRFKGEVE